MKGYLFSKEAENDLIEIYRYGFVNYGEQKAEAYLQALKVKCEFLANNPQVNRERDEFKEPVRFHSHKSHLIIYSVEIEVILIVRILHGRMNVPSYLDN